MTERERERERERYMYLFHTQHCAAVQVLIHKLQQVYSALECNEAEEEHCSAQSVGRMLPP